MSVLFVFFILVAIVSVDMVAVQLVGWVRAGEDAGEVRKRTLLASLMFVLQVAFVIVIAVVFPAL